MLWFPPRKITISFPVSGNSDTIFPLSEIKNYPNAPEKPTVEVG
jgi:hypothetical protein